MIMQKAHEGDSFYGRKKENRITESQVGLSTISKVLFLQKRTEPNVKKS
jgi:hypothetical protein